jgi:hypothetical protein
MSGHRSVAIVLLAISASIRVPTVWGYELRTHWQIADQAFEVSSGMAAYLESVRIDPSQTFTVEQPAPPRQLALFQNNGTLVDG